MVLRCCVINCFMSADKDSEIKFFRFPVIPKIRKKYSKLAEERQRAWLKAINRKDLKVSSLNFRTVCSKHFLNKRSADIKDVLNPDWVPSLELGYPKATSTSTMSRYERTKKRTERKELVTSPPKPEPVSEDLNIIPPRFQDKSCQTIIICEDKSCQTEEFYFDCDKENQIEELKTKIMILSEKMKVLQEENLVARTKISMEDLKNSAKKTKYFTGLEDYDTLECVFKHVEHFLPINFKRNMSSFDIFLMTFMKLRLDLPFTYLAFQYNVSSKTISYLFHKAIVSIHDRMSCFVFWPDKKASMANIPQPFKQLFGIKPIFIIDCFEIFAGKPGNCLARSNTYSAYKHHQTIKYLICISAFGSIAFISKGYGGRCSDKFVFENCGILDFIEEGGIIMADRGFLTENSIKKKKKPDWLCRLSKMVNPN